MSENDEKRNPTVTFYAAGLGVMAVTRRRAEAIGLPVWEDAPLPKLRDVFSGVYVRESGARSTYEQLADEIAKNLFPAGDRVTGSAARLGGQRQATSSLRRRADATMEDMRAFVLSGGASLGAIQVGMLEALFERRIVPDLVVEVLSPTTRRIDATTKLRLFERSAVAEYWMIDPDREWVEVHRASPGGFREVARLVRERGDGPLTSPLFPGFALRLDRLFR